MVNSVYLLHTDGGKPITTRSSVGFDVLRNRPLYLCPMVHKKGAGTKVETYTLK